MVKKDLNCVPNLYCTSGASLLTAAAILVEVWSCLYISHGCYVFGLQQEIEKLHWYGAVSMFVKRNGWGFSLL